MITDFDRIRKIYDSFCDEPSKDIFINRLSYSITRKKRYMDAIIDESLRKSELWVTFLEELKERAKEKELVLFGAGIWGRTLYDETKEIIPWKCAIDRTLGINKMGNLNASNTNHFLKQYNDERIVISSYKNQHSMRDDLCNAGIPEENIIDAGSVINALTEGRIYFDDTVMDLSKPIEGAFIDGGSFDGTDTRRFFSYAGGDKSAFCFEPDTTNISLMKSTLKEFEGKYFIIPKAMWDKNTTLGFSSHGNCSSHITEVSYENIVPSGSIDTEVSNQRIAMIKMDIEGAELRALHGAMKTIRRDNPILAISVYHKPQDILTIPDYIMSLGLDYKFYLRHYSFSNYDTVLYAIPQEQ